MFYSRTVTFKSDPIWSLFHSELIPCQQLGHKLRQQLSRALGRYLELSFVFIETSNHLVGKYTFTSGLISFSVNNTIAALCWILNANSNRFDLSVDERRYGIRSRSLLQENALSIERLLYLSFWTSSNLHLNQSPTLGRKNFFLRKEVKLRLVDAFLLL